MEDHIHDFIHKIDEHGQEYIECACGAKEYL